MCPAVVQPVDFGLLTCRLSSRDEAVLDLHRSALTRGLVQVPKGAGVIQGDGINLTSLSNILSAVLRHGYSAEVQITCYVCCEQSAFNSPMSKPELLSILITWCPSMWVRHQD